MHLFSGSLRSHS
ncbi:TPA: hypothetical protein N0F65_012596 [Lagenidium giganteum]|uniref:Uncharacterized protein n=1 Tax=Lagenidium giganteum TaxID=4803 RepID=A0AAV2YS80_9STRA|nr:TPA: hypothetical protein N0F65_012596 [Lagenidium giganteum]